MFQLRPLAQTVAQRHEGTLGNVVGHRLLIYFGYPQAHEDDAERAVRAALDLISEASEHLGRGSTGRTRPALRVGIHTGPAVVSTSPNAPEPVVLGTTLDVALRQQAAAAPGTVVISTATRSLVQRGFTTEALAPLSAGRQAGESLVPYRVRETSDVGDEGTVDLAPHGRPRARAGSADEPVGAGPRRDRAGGAAERRARHGQIAAPARHARARERAVGWRRRAMALGPRLALHAEHAASPGRPSAAAHARIGAGELVARAARHAAPHASP